MGGLDVRFGHNYFRSATDMFFVSERAAGLGRLGNGFGCFRYYNCLRMNSVGSAFL